MDGFTIIDGVVAAVIVISALLAYSRGLVREVMAIAGWIGATIVAFLFADAVVPLVRQIPTLGDFIGDSCELALIAAFALVFAVALLVVSLFTPLFSSVVQRSVLNAPDQALGFLFGIARGVLLVAVGFFVYQTVLATQDIAIIEDSRSARIFNRFGSGLEEQEPEAALGWITAQYNELIDSCAAPADPVEAETPAN